MTVSTAPTFSQIRAQVAAIRQRLPGARTIGIRAAGRWTGDAPIPCGDETYLVRQCDSPLAMRVALREPVDERTVRVLVTPLDQTELGDDVLLRLEKRRLFPLDDWQIVRSLFQAHDIDPRLAPHRWIAGALIHLLPPEEHRPAPGGFLDAEIVWPLLLRNGIGLDAERPDLPALLKWSLDPVKVERCRNSSPEFRAAAAEWLAGSAGPAAEIVLRCVAESERPEALSIGLAAAVVFHAGAGGRLDKAAGRMEERFLGGVAPPEPLLSRWSAAASEVVRHRLSDPRLKRQQLERADEILREVGADAFAFLSDTSPLGFDQRLAAFARCLTGAWDTGLSAAPAALEERRREVLDHHLAAREQQRLDRLAMAVRLVRWLAAPRVPAPRSFAEAARYQVGEGGFVDWARLTLRAGDPVRELAQAYAALFERVREKRERQSEQFASLLKDWTAAGSTGGGAVPVERVLEQIVAPLAARAPVLLIVLDGMTAAVCRELLADVARHDWTLVRELDAGAAVRPGLATLPSVTEVSRTSLLCGRLCRGTSAEEKTGFAAHPALLANCRGGQPPVLLHKPVLQGGDGGTLAPEVREEIASPRRRVVGVVINAIDDQLLKGEQMDPQWTGDQIRPLRSLLHEARAAGRVVVLVSDHGHVLETGTSGKMHEGGERWRVDDGDPTAGEIRIGGSRVVMPESGSLIVPWSERLRYGVKRNGYHGGATPQEMVVPIAVLCAPGRCPEGWVEAAVDMPAWWEQPLAGPPPAPAPGRQVRTIPPGLLFDPDAEESPGAPPAPVDADEIARLLASPLFAQQTSLAGQSATEVEAVGRLLTVLDGCGGRISTPALSRILAFPPTYLRALIVATQRVLNVDGYAVLHRDEETDSLVLDREQLRRQFELGEDAGGQSRGGS